MTKETKKRISAINSGIIPDGYKKTKVGIVPVEWEECHFKKMFARLKRKNTENNTNVLTISAQYGLINQEEFFNKSVASENKSNYFLLHKGDFAYNKSYSNGYPFGAIKSLKKYDKGVVSPLYICFSPTVGNSCPDFYLHYFENGLMNREIQAIAQEGARNHGLLNIGIDDFFNSYLIIPPLPEQQKIAEILSTQDKLIELYERKIEQLKTLKKGYLQKMFPKKGCKYPELRFKGFTDDWEQRKFSEIADTRRGLTYKPSSISERGVRVLRSSNINEDTFVFGNDDVFVEESAVHIPYVNDGDILITSANGSTRLVGKHTIIRDLLQNPTIHGGFMIVASSKNPDFLNASMSSYWYSQFISLYVSGGNGSIGNLNKNDLDMQIVFVPNEEEQQQIGSYFKNLDRLITLHQHKLDKEKQKKKALMQLLLTGKVRVST